jgi:hypothetical protein
MSDTGEPAPAATVPLPPGTLDAATRLVGAAREAIGALPFGHEPQDFLVVLEEEAEDRPPAEGARS